MASTARIDELQKKFDENPRRYFAPLANEFRKSGQLDRAIALCREHLPKQPGHMSGHIVYGQALYELGEPEEARRVFQSALELDPENVIALRQMGDIERAGGHVDEARRWYTRVLDADPRNGDVMALVDSLGEMESSEPAANITERSWPPEGRSAVDEPSVLHPEEFDPGPQPTAEAIEINADLANISTSASASDDPAGDPFSYPADEALPGTDVVAGESISPFDREPAFADAPFADAPFADQAMVTSPEDDWRVDVEPIDGALRNRGTRDDAFIGEMEEPLSLIDPGTQPSGWASGWQEAVTPVEEPMGAAGGAGLETPVVEELDLAPVAADIHADPVVPSIEAFAYDDETVDERGRELPLIDAFGYDAADELDEALPSIAAYAFDDRALEEEAVGVAGTEPPLAAIAAADAPSIDEFLYDGALAERVSEPVAEPVAVEPPAEAPSRADSPFVTETMAELYLRQGFRDEALGVYRQLLASDPYNTAISAKVRELTGEHPLVAVDSGNVAAVGSDAAPEPAAVTPVASPIQSWEPAVNARAFFAALAVQRGPGADRAPAPPVSVAQRKDAGAAGDAVGRGAAVPVDELLMIESYGYEVANAGSVVDGGTLDALFGHAPVRPDDGAAATALAAAFGAPPSQPNGEPRAGRETAGRAAQPATSEPSLDAIFRSGDSGTESKRRATPTAFSFDQFFTDEPSPSAGPSGPPPAARLGEESAGDLEEFNSWLDSLKRR